MPRRARLDAPGTLNPLRAGIVQRVAELDRYAWSGHSVLMEQVQYGWKVGRWLV